MLNFLKSTFGQPSVNSEAEAIVEELALQDVRSYPFDLKKFTAGVKFQNADPQEQRAIVMAMIDWVSKHPLGPHPHFDQKADRKSVV